jgi:hypothetical protein
MTAREAHYAFSLGMDRVASNTNPDFTDVEKDYFLNEGQNLFIEETYTTSNLRNQGFEQTQKRFDDLSTLVVHNEALTPTVFSTDAYEVKLSQLTNTYRHFISGRATTSLNGCLKTLNLKLVQHDDLYEALKNPFIYPDYVLFTFSQDTTSSLPSIILYPQKGTLTSVLIDYIKTPNRFSLGTYPYIDGVTYPENTFEAPEYTHQRIVDRAVKIASIAIQSPEYIQPASLKTTLDP